MNRESNMELQQIIGENIKSYRKVMGFTQQNLADLLGVSAPSITYYEKGQREVDLLKLNKLADLFSIELSDLLEKNDGVISLNAVVAYKKQGLGKGDLDTISKFRKIVKNYIRLNDGV
jgi:transcriptional regulator with XRE-family HTH domain